MRTFPLMVFVLLIPIVPFLFIGETIQEMLDGVTSSPPSPLQTSLLSIGLLTTDIFLPIPSSVISTLNGWRLGWWLGTFVTWTGMNLGAILGFVLASRYGQRFATWFSDQDDLRQMHRLIDRYGPSVLVMTRAIPVFAEAGVLMAGIHSLAWRRFLPAVLASNLVVAITYSTLGDLAEKYQWLTVAIGIAIGVPLMMAAIGSRFVSRIQSPSSHSDSQNHEI
ncbi:VTT domain-containing protein [bacterium]|nr:VTT domain-containing protein [bacterium]